MAFFLQHAQGKGGVPRGQLRAVVKSRLGAHRETVGQLVGGDLYRLRGKPIHRVGFVVGAHHQGHKGHIHALRALALEDVGVERIKGEKRLVVGADRRDQRKCPALGGRRIDVVEVMKIGRIFQIAKGRHAVGFGAGFRRPRGPQPRRSERTNPETKHMLARQRRRAKPAQERLPILAALSASHHHRVGKPDTPYCGSGSGWLKRSQRA